MTRRGSAARYYRKRLEWLRDRPMLCVGAPTLSEDVTPAGSAVLDVLVAEMTAAGLFGQFALEASKRETVRRLLGELRSGKAKEAYW